LLSANAERTFVRLWTYCDDEGRAKANPKLLKAALYPVHDDITVEMIMADLAEMEAAGLVMRYSVAGASYLTVPSWHRWQKPQRPSPSRLPQPPRRGHSARVPRVLREPSGTHPRALHAGEGDRSKEKEIGEGTGEESAASADAVREDFERAWVHYPRKKEKPDALAAYRATRKRRVSAADLLTATKNYGTAKRAEIASGSSEPRFVKLGATFYGPKEPWRDWLTGDPDAAQVNGRTPGTYALGERAKVDYGS
jgi:hypothetical protein